MAEWEVRVGDALTLLRAMPDESVHCVVTSPPYWGLRDYGTATWDGGDKDCDHREQLGGEGASSAKQNTSTGTQSHQYRAICGKCGATRTDDQLGLEPTPELYVAKLVEVFREVRRVLRVDGTCWLNLGDSYTSGGCADYGPSKPDKNIVLHNAARAPQPPGLKPKDLCMIPARVALALQADGWWLRSDVIWSKSNPMPESVRDRPTKAHEYVFLLTKSARYFYDAEAVAEASITADPRRPYTSNGAKDLDGRAVWRSGEHRDGDDFTTRNRRSVWTITTKPYPGAHFAVFPPELPEVCIKAGTSQRGACPECGAPWERVVEVQDDNRRTYKTIGVGAYGEGAGRCDGVNRPRKVLRDDGRGGDLATKQRTTVGWRPTCECIRSVCPDKEQTGAEWLRIIDETAERFQPVPCVVLDPFSGAGTTGLVATRLGRAYVGLELNPKYAEMSRRRIMSGAGTLPEDGWEPAHDDLPLFGALDG